MEPNELTTQILIEIRDEIRANKAETREGLASVREELRETKSELSVRIDGTNARLERLERRQTETEVRLATEIVALAGSVHELRDVLLADRALRATVADHERRLTRIESGER